MIGAAVGLIGLVGYVTLVVAMVRWMRRRLLQRAQRAADALKASGATIHAVTPSQAFGAPAVVDYELDGKRGLFHVRRYGRDYVLLSVYVHSHPLPGLLIRAESAVDRLGKSLGLNREVQVGDAAFDGAAYLVSNASDEVVRQLLAAPEVRKAVLDILALGYKVEMSTEGLRATRLQFGLDAFDPAPVPAVMRALEVLAPLLPKIEAGKLVPTPKLGLSRVVIAAAVFSAISVFAFFLTVRGLRPPVDDVNSLKAIGLGFPAWLLAVGLLGLKMRARPTGMFELGIAAGVLFFGVPMATAGVLLFANSGLDSSPAITHTTTVVSTHHRKGDNDLRVEPWDPARTWQKIGVDHATFQTIHAGDRIDVDVHPGALGWPWVSAVRRLQ